MITRVSLDLAYERVGLGDRQARIDGDRHLSLEPMAEISGTDVRDLLDFRGVLNGVLQLAHNIRINAVQHARDHGFGRLPNDAENRHGDNDANNWVRQREADPYPCRSYHHGEAGKTVRARVIAVGDQRGAVDRLARPDADVGSDFVAQKTDEPGRRDGEEIGDRGRVNEAVHSLP